MGLGFGAEHKILSEKTGSTRILQSWPYISEKAHWILQNYSGLNSFLRGRETAVQADRLAPYRLRFSKQKVATTLCPSVSFISARVSLEGDNGRFELRKLFAPNYGDESVEPPGIIFRKEHAAMAIHPRGDHHNIGPPYLRPKLFGPTPSHFPGMTLYIPSGCSASLDQMAYVSRVPANQYDPQLPSGWSWDITHAFCF
jgi:hypothetical protein